VMKRQILPGTFSRSIWGKGVATSCIPYCPGCFDIAANARLEV
jgi:hypothetical protein